MNVSVVIGITSWGHYHSDHGCGTVGWPSAYAYVPHYIQWIKPIMEEGL